MDIALNKAHYPVTVLGPGRRIGLWVQGCSIACKGCVSQDTWPREDSRRMPVAQLLAWCEQVSAGQLDGITISGGEPFEQPAALRALLEGLQRWRRRRRLRFDVLCYSGLPLARLRREHAPLLALLDAVIAEPFVHTQPSDHPWLGSANQRLVPLSALGRERYAPGAPMPDAPPSKRMQLLVDGQKVWYVGIPAHGDMDRLQALCSARGLDFAQVSWRS